MKLLAIAAALVASIGTCAANADTINFGQFSGELPNTITGTTTGGVGITITGPGSGFDELTQDSSWLGNFPDNTNVLYDNGVPGATTIDFASVLTSLSQVGVEANLYGAYTATLTAYLNGLAVGTQQFS